MAIRGETDDQLVLETPHRRLGEIARPLVTLRRGADHLLVEARGGKGGEPVRLPLGRVEAVRLVPSVSPARQGWFRRRQQERWALALRFRGGEDLLLEQGLEAQGALTLARKVGDLTGLRLDEASRRMFGLAEPDTEVE